MGEMKSDPTNLFIWTNQTIQFETSASKKVLQVAMVIHAYTAEKLNRPPMILKRINTTLHCTEGFH